ncbi:FliM/FliN family flagellar motor switch protein [Pseudomonas synxantha]|uniref:FliM/FliN family flagellar motor switch protein n=1 Tax=Pseudomonas synxantha TaxID=47883 RepID=UPI000F57CD70|nr:FliM/FliN family flagellar motor switch protein [Pseudomonas synxantha]AZE76542.1 Type III secretion inner membrane protein (YscQ) [Pseudomonas synxantha]
MMLPPLIFPAFKAEIATARQRLGHGMSMPFEVAGSSGELKMEPGAAPVGVQPLCFETACGVLAFSEPGPQFSLMGECPVTLAQAGNDPDAWFWALFQHHLSPQVQALFGHLRLLPGTRPLNFGCRFCVTLGASRVVGYLWLSVDSFLALCQAGPWRSVAKPMPTQFQLAIDVTLGRLQLPMHQLRSVRAGDVLVLEQAFFSASGTGHVQVGKRRLVGWIDAESGPMRLTLTSIEDMLVDEDFAAQPYSGHEDETAVTDVFGHEPFDELSMALNVRCGTLNLTLGELRNLAPGAVLGVSGYAPGTAGLYYGDRPLGLGQLVEVDGRLGLQMSRVIFSR